MFCSCVNCRSWWVCSFIFHFYCCDMFILFDRRKQDLSFPFLLQIFNITIFTLSFWLFLLFFRSATPSVRGRFSLWSRVRVEALPSGDVFVPCVESRCRCGQPKLLSAVVSQDFSIIIFLFSSWPNISACSFSQLNRAHRFWVSCKAW